MRPGPSPEVPWWGRRSASELVIIVAGYASNRQVTEWALPDGQLMINDGGGWKEVKKLWNTSPAARSRRFRCLTWPSRARAWPTTHEP
jgi:hypothetical protein